MATSATQFVYEANLEAICIGNLEMVAELLHDWNAFPIPIVEPVKQKMTDLESAPKLNKEAEKHFLYYKNMSNQPAREPHTIETIEELILGGMIFVFGTNESGFHGTGSAGFALRGNSDGTWREDQSFLKIKNQVNSKTPLDSSLRKGQFAVFGQARGLQIGTRGASYGIQTIVKPGQRRSTTRREIYAQLVKLGDFARSNPKMVFIMTEIGQGYSGYTKEEMDVVHCWWIKHHNPPMKQFLYVTLAS